MTVLGDARDCYVWVHCHGGYGSIEAAGDDFASDERESVEGSVVVQRGEYYKVDLALAPLLRAFVRCVKL